MQAIHRKCTLFNSAAWKVHEIDAKLQFEAEGFE